MPIEKQIELKNKIITMMEDMNDDDDTGILEKAMDYYCSMWDVREGMKHAITLTLNDQYDNHSEEQDGEDLQKLFALLSLNLK